MTATLTARDRLDPLIVDYLDGAAGGGSTLRGNVAAWNHWRLRPRVLRDVSTIRTDSNLFGIPLAAPIFVAPWAGHAFVDPDGDLATAQGIRQAGIGLGLSMGASSLLADVGAVAGPYLQQIYLPSERELIVPFVHAAVAAGAAAFLLTVDAPAVGNRVAFRAGLASLRPASSGSVNFPGVDQSRLGTSATLSAADIAWLVDVSDRPVLAKGIVRADDARMVVHAGAAGVVVSNHSGRQLDGGVATAQALPEVVAAIGDDAVVLVDGGIDQGEDVLRALALGADAVLVGRPFVWALADGGADGVAALALELRTGLQTAMAMCGAAQLDQLTPDLVLWTPETL